MLTRKQYELLMFIHERIREAGVPPSFDEMKDALDLKSKSGIHRLITALEERGFLRRMEKRARALEVIRLPENMAETARPALVAGSSTGSAPAMAAAPIRATPARARRWATAKARSMCPWSGASPPVRRLRRCRIALPMCRCPAA